MWFIISFAEFDGVTFDGLRIDGLSELRLL